MLLGGVDGTLVLWHPVCGKLPCLTGGHTDAVLAIALAPDGIGAATGSRDTTTLLWDVPAVGKASSAV